MGLICLVDHLLVDRILPQLVENMVYFLVELVQLPLHFLAGLFSVALTLLRSPLAWVWDWFTEVIMR